MLNFLKNEEGKFVIFKKIKRPALMKNSKRAFWIWIGYQAVKGTLTTTFIWIPMLYMWWHQ